MSHSHCDSSFHPKCDSTLILHSFLSACSSGPQEILSGISQHRVSAGCRSHDILGELSDSSIASCVTYDSTTSNDTTFHSRPRPQVLLSTTLLVCSASASSPSSPSLSSASEPRGYSSHAPPQSGASYEAREPEAVYSNARNAYRESGEEAPVVPEDYAPKAPQKKTVILAIPVKLALQQHAGEKHAPASYGNQRDLTSELELSRMHASMFAESSGESYGSRQGYPTSYTSYADQAGSRVEAGNSESGRWLHSRRQESERGVSGAGANMGHSLTSNQNNHNRQKQQQQFSERFREQDHPNTSPHNSNLNDFTFKSSTNNYNNDETVAGNGNAYGSSSSSSSPHNSQYEYTVAVPKHQNSPQAAYNQASSSAPSYTASASQGHPQASPVTYHTRDQGSERYLRTYSDKSPPPKPYNPDNDVDGQSHSSYSSASPYESSPKLSRQPSSYSPAEESGYEVEEVPHHRPRKTHKRPAAYLEESAEEESYSPPTSSSSYRQPSSKYLSSLEAESDPYSGLEGGSTYPSELAESSGKNSHSNLQAYEGLEDADYSSLSALGLQSYSSPSLPQSELSYLMSKMPRGGFSHVPASSASYAGLDLGSGSRLGSYNHHPFGLPSRAMRRPYGPNPYAPNPYLKVS